MVADEFVLDNQKVAHGDATISNFADVNLPEDYPILETINCEILNVKRQQTTSVEIFQGLEFQFQNPAQIDSLTNFYKKSKKFIFTVKALKPGKCSITQKQNNNLVVYEKYEIPNKESSFNWTYRGPIFKFFSISILIFSLLGLLNFKITRFLKTKKS